MNCHGRCAAAIWQLLRLLPTNQQPCFIVTRQYWAYVFVDLVWFESDKNRRGLLSRLQRAISWKHDDFEGRVVYHCTNKRDSHRKLIRDTDRSLHGLHIGISRHIHLAARLPDSNGKCGVDEAVRQLPMQHLGLVPHLHGPVADNRIIGAHHQLARELAFRLARVNNRGNDGFAMRLQYKPAFEDDLQERVWIRQRQVRYCKRQRCCIEYFDLPLLLFHL